MHFWVPTSRVFQRETECRVVSNHHMDTRVLVLSEKSLFGSMVDSRMTRRRTPQPPAAPAETPVFEV